MKILYLLKLLFKNIGKFTYFSTNTPTLFSVGISFLLIFNGTIHSQESGLLDCINSGDVDGLIHLLKSGKNPNETDSEGKPILLYAHENFLKNKSDKNKNIYINLVRAGANVNTRTSNAIRNNSIQKKTILHELTEWGHLDLAKFILDMGGNAKEKIDSNTLLHIAAEKSNRDFINLYLDRALSVDEKGENGESPLFFALRAGKTENVKFLLEKGANSNLINYSGDVPLTLAIAAADMNLVKILIKSGAKVSYINEMGNTLLFTAAGTAVVNNKKMIPIIKLLLESGLNLNSQNIYGNTILSYTLAARNLDLLTYFLKNRANPNIPDNMGNTLVHKLVLHSLHERLKNKELEDFAQKIFHFGGSTEIKNNEGQTPLHIALKPYRDRDENAMLQCVRILLDRSANPLIEDRLGANAFDYANSEAKKLLNASIPSLSLEILYKDPKFKFKSFAASEGKLFLLGDLDKSSILMQFSLEGISDKQVLLENSRDMVVLQDGLYISGISKDNVEKQCFEKIFIQKLNFSLQEEWKNVLETSLPCDGNRDVNLLSVSNDTVVIQYSLKENKKTYVLNRENGSRQKEIPIFEKIYSLYKSKERYYFVGKYGVHIFSSDFSPKEKKDLSKKKQLLLAISEDSVFSVLPNLEKSGFSLSKSDLSYSGIWRRDYSSNDIDNPMFLKILGDNVLLAGITKGSLHGNTNTGRLSNIFVQNSNTSGIRKFTFQSSEESSLSGFIVSPRGDIYISGVNASGTWIGRLQPIPKK